MAPRLGRLYAPNGVLLAHVQYARAAPSSVASLFGSGKLAFGSGKLARYARGAAPNRPRWFMQVCAEVVQIFVPGLCRSLYRAGESSAQSAGQFAASVRGCLPDGEAYGLRSYTFIQNAPSGPCG